MCFETVQINQALLELGHGRQSQVILFLQLKGRVVFSQGDVMHEFSDHLLHTNRLHGTQPPPSLYTPALSRLAYINIAATQH